MSLSHGSRLCAVLTVQCHAVLRHVLRCAAPCHAVQHRAALCRAMLSPDPSAPQPRIRLKGGAKAGEGRVEVLKNNEWGTICDDRWNLLSASVVCRELGFGSAKEALTGARMGQGESAVAEGPGTAFSPLCCTCPVGTWTQGVGFALSISRAGAAGPVCPCWQLGRAGLGCGDGMVTASPCSWH